MTTALKDLILIGIHGAAGSGKDTVAGILRDNFLDVYGEPFAGPLKEACAAAFGLEIEDFYNSLAKEHVNDYWQVSPRQIAQFVGTEMFRETVAGLVGPKIAENFWINRLAGRLTGELCRYNDAAYEPGEIITITDVRFQNEYDFIMNNGGCIIHLTRPGADGIVGIQNHASEVGIPDKHTKERLYEVANDSTLEELEEKILAIFKPILADKIKPTEF